MLDTLDGVEHTTGNPSNALDSVDAGLVPVVADNTDHAEADVMIPPLQAKLELLKRATDVPNIYNDMEPEHDCGCSGECECDDNADYAEEDEVSGIKRLAGVPVTAIFTAADDEPFEG
jgi:hypothetical protein